MNEHIKYEPRLNRAVWSRFVRHIESLVTTGLFPALMGDTVLPGLIDFASDGV